MLGRWWRWWLKRCRGWCIYIVESFKSHIVAGVIIWIELVSWIAIAITLMVRLHVKRFLIPQVRVTLGWTRKKNNVTMMGVLLSRRSTMLSWRDMTTLGQSFVRRGLVQRSLWIRQLYHCCLANRNRAWMGQGQAGDHISFRTAMARRQARYRHQSLSLWRWYRIACLRRRIQVR